VEIVPILNPKTKQKKISYDYAIKIAHNINYNNAGTEFLVDKEENIYFIEVNL
jgi:pyruvate carboxylase